MSACSQRNQADSETCQRAWETGAAHYDTRKERIPNPDSLRLEIQALNRLPVLKQDRSPERGRPSGIEAARRLRMDADDVALFS